MKYKKIRIVGASGSGKTYLGERLSQKLGIVHYPLDEVVYDFSNTVKFDNKRSFEERNKIYKEIIKKNKWIIDGSYISWSQDSYTAADIIIYLHKPLVIRAKNNFKRFIARIFQGKYEGVCNFFILNEI